MFNTPILFLIFNRPDTTQIVFEEIRKQKPKYLYIAADGARANKEGEAEKCEHARKLVLDSIDWDCEVKTLFRDNNLGCGLAVSGAITWFFENVEQGIILEDDCLPNESFFGFCEEMLEKYKDDSSVMHIGGHSLGVHNQNKYKNKYFFSAYNHIWGWATWRRAWNLYQFKMDNINLDIIEKQISKYFQTRAEIEYWKNTIKKSKDVDTWDYQWTLSIWLNNGKSILPTVNIVKNIGFGLDATHTKNESLIANIALYTHIDLDKISLLLGNNEINFDIDRQMSNFIFDIPTMISPITNKNNTVLEKGIKTSMIIDSYKNAFNIDISHFFEGILEVRIFKCLDTGYRFYYPFNIDGDGRFYEHFQQYDWYYMSWKWEHETVKSKIRITDKVLEIGCAKGSFVENLSKSQIDCTGLELNEKAVKEAKEKGLKVYYQSIQEHSKTHNEVYDVVCSFQVMEHIASIKDVIQASLDCLKKGGRLFISVPNNGSFLGLDENNILNMPPHHMGLWDKTSLSNLSKVLNVRVENIYLEPLQKYHESYFGDIINKELERRYEPLKIKYGILAKIGLKFFKTYVASYIKHKIYKKYPELESFTIIAEYTKL